MEGTGRILNPNWTPAEKITALGESVAEIWDRLETQSRQLQEAQTRLDNSGKMSLEQIYQLVRNLKQVAHRGVMPDIAGTNDDHDRRYVKKADVASYLGDYARNFDDLEMILEYIMGTLTRCVDYTYDMDDDLTLITIYADDTRAVTLFTKVLTYNGDKDIIQKVLTRISDGKTLTTDLTYTGDNLTNKKNKPST